MEIQDLTNSKGLLPMKLGTARIILGYNNLIHIIRLDQYQQATNKIKQTLQNLEHVEPLQDSLSTTQAKLDELDHKLHTLFPNHRNRRGLVNGLGTLIKSITGNMDANDAAHLNQQIEILLNSDRNITNKLNLQSKLNLDMIERFQNITNHVNNQQQIIDEYLNTTSFQFRNKIRTQDINIRYIQFLSHVNYNIDLLNNHLNSISEAIIFAKLNIIPRQILSKSELSKIGLELKNQNVTIKSNQHLYELLGIQAYYNSTNIIFNILIPILSSEASKMFHIIPLPFEESKMIQAKPYLAMNPSNIQYYDEKCPKLEGVYYCKKSTFEEATTNSRCIGNLILNKPAHCELYERTQNTQIFQPEPNYIILLNVPETMITSSCGPNQTIKGSALIHFGNCNITINNIIYKPADATYWDEIHIFPTLLREINTTIPSYNHTIRSTRLQPYEFNEKDFSEILGPYVHQDDFYKPFGILITSLILIMGAAYLAIIWGIRKLLQKRKVDVLQDTPAIEPGNIRFIWPTLTSRGGGVTSPN